jgi:hypothetical protein
VRKHPFLFILNNIYFGGRNMPTKTRINGQNCTQLPRLVSDDVILKGLPQTPGAPEGYGDLAQAVKSTSRMVNVESFGAVGSVTPVSVADNSTSIQAAIDYANSIGGVVTGDSSFFYSVASPVTFKGDAGLFNLRLSAATGFTGAYIVGFGEVGVPYKSDFGVCGFTLDCQSANAIGCHFVDFQRVNATGISIENNANIGMLVGSDGYELYVANINISGPIPPAAPAPDTSVCLRVTASDCSFVNAAGSRNAIGVDLIGSGNKFAMTHFWSTYFSSHCRMRVCYHIKGQHNSFTGMTIDSPSRLVWGSPSSLANGGYGVLVDTNAIDTTIVNPYLFLSSAGDSLPTSQSIIPIYVDKSRLTITNPKARNDTGVPDAVQNFVIASSTAVLRSATMMGVAQAGANMPENAYITDSFSQWVPDLKIGGASTGITYGNRRGMLKRVGSLAFFNINVNLTSKGALTGALTFDLTVSNLNEYSDYKLVFQGLIETQTGTLPVVGVLLNNSTQLVLRNPETNAAITDAAITNTSRITITGSFLTSTV